MTILRAGRVAAAIALAALCGTALPSPAVADQAQRPTVETVTVASATDGDTFRTTTGERVRVAGIDAPETQKGQAKCQHEIRRGRAATSQVQRLIEGRRVTLTRTGRSYKRTVARVTIDGRDLASELIRRDIARPWPRGTPKPDWCARP